MSKEFNGYIPEATQYIIKSKGTSKSLSITCMLAIASPYRFAELLDADSKIKIKLQEGTGEEATKVTFNLTVDEFEYIYDMFMYGRLPLPHKLYKPLQNKIKEGEYKGKWYTSTFTLEYVQGYNNPWKIEVTNAYGNEQNGMDIKKTTVKSMMVDSTLHKLLKKTMEYIDFFRNTFCGLNVENGVRKCAEFQKGAYDPFKELGGATDVDNPVASAPEDMMNPADYYSEQQYQNPNPPQQPQATVQPQNNGRDIRRMKMQVMSEPISFENSYVCQVMIGGMQYPLYFQSIHPKLKESFEDGVIIEANLFSYNGKLCLDSI